MSHSYNSIEEVLKAVKSNQLSIMMLKPNSVIMTNWALLKLTYIEHSVKGFPKLSLGKENKRTNH